MPLVLRVGVTFRWGVYWLGSVLYQGPSIVSSCVAQHQPHPLWSWGSWPGRWCFLYVPAAQDENTGICFSLPACFSQEGSSWWIVHGMQFEQLLWEDKPSCCWVLKQTQKAAGSGSLTSCPGHVVQQWSNGNSTNWRRPECIPWQCCPETLYSLHSYSGFCFRPFLVAGWSQVQEFSPSPALKFPWFFCICGRVIDFVGLALETKEQIALVQEALSWHSSFSFGWFGPAVVGIANSLLDEIKLIILGRHWEAAMWERQQEHQAV